MRHPFEGVIVPDEASSACVNRTHGETLGANQAADRRGFLRRLGALAAAAGGGLALSRAGLAMGQEGTLTDEPREQRRGESPADNVGPRHSDADYTTQALGEEGGRYGDPARVTTYALGEEAGQGHDRRGRYRYTTYALGEEGSYRDGYDWRRWYPPPRYDDWQPWPWGGRWRPDDRYTTQALGEEGGRRY
jgi:hypothetical protein